MITFLAFFIAFFTIISGLILLFKASDLIYENQRRHKTELTITGIILLSFGLGLLLSSIINLVINLKI